MRATLDLPSAAAAQTPNRGSNVGAAHGDPDLLDVQMAVGGSREAFNRLVLRYQDVVVHVASHSLNNPEDAFDAAQDAFLKMFRSLRSFRGGCAFRTWLLHIVINSARSLRTRQTAKKRGGQISGRFALELTSIDPSNEPPDPYTLDAPAALLERKEVKNALEQAIGELGDSDREVILLRDISGHSYESIATQLDLPLGTIKSRVHRARLELRRKMEPYL